MENQILLSGSAEDSTAINYSGEVQPPRRNNPRFTCWIGPFFFRNPRRLTILEWIFLVVSVLTLAVALAMNVREIIMFSTAEYISSTIGFNSNYCRNIANTSTVVFTCESELTIGLVVLVNIAFVLYFILYGLFREQKYDMLAFAFLVAATCLYIIIDFTYQIAVGESRLECWWIWARFIITLLLSPINIVLAIAVFWKMGILLFDSLGANPVLHKAYKWTRLLSSAVKLNFEALTTLFVLVVTRGPLHNIGIDIMNPLAPHPAEVVIACLLFLAGVLGIVLSTIGVYMEKKIFSIGYLVIQLCTAVYYVFRIVWTTISWEENFNTVDPNEDFDATAANAIIIMLPCFAGIILTMIIIPVYYIVMKNYGKGLKDRFFG